jgi:hypothetical protein
MATRARAIEARPHAQRVLRSASRRLAWACALVCLVLVQRVQAQQPTDPRATSAVDAEGATTTAEPADRDTPLTAFVPHGIASGDPDAAPSRTDASEKPKSGWAALPIGTYAPETQLGLGGFASHFFRVGKVPPRSRPSSVSIVGLYTMEQQLIAELIPEIYWDEQRWHVWSRVDYRRYPTLTWGVGQDAPKSSREAYTEDRLRWMATVDHSIDGPLRLAGKLEAIYVTFRNLDPGGSLEQGLLPGSAGGRTVGIGPGLIWDTRDHMLQPHEGELYELAVMTWGEPNARAPALHRAADRRCAVLQARAPRG